MFKTQSSYSLKLIILCGLVLVMSIPAMFVSSIVFERSSRADDAVQEVSRRYGGAQVMSGPVLALPSWRANPLEVDNFEMPPHKRDAAQYIIFPKTGRAVFNALETIPRKRGLFNVPTYQGDVTFTAQFPDIKAITTQTGRKFDLEKAVVFFAIRDPRGLLSDPVLEFENGPPLILQPARTATAVPCCDIHIVDDKIVRQRRPQGLQAHGGLTYLYAPVGDILDRISRGPVSIKFRLSGAQSLSVPPFAKSTQMEMSSDWKHPGFDGHFPPADYTQSPSGFTAQWSVPFLARNIIAHGTAGEAAKLNTGKHVMRVNFISPLNPYRMLNRALKYSVLFIGMIFLSFFLSEIIMSVAIHPAQYGLVGLAQAVFYLLLLAFSEQFGFHLGFFISAAATIALTALYAATSFGDKAYALRYGAIFTLVYGFMFILLRVQGVALLTSAVMSFALIALTMYLTRDLDWYGQKPPAKDAAKDAGQERLKNAAN